MDQVGESRGDRTVAGRPIAEWVAERPVLADVVAARETAWFPPRAVPTAEALPDVGLTRADIDGAEARLRRFAPYLAQAFPALRGTDGLIESPLRRISEAQRALVGSVSRVGAVGRVGAGSELPGALWAKCDSELPVSGSIKARGGIHEVLEYAERLALEAGLIRTDSHTGTHTDYRVLASPAARDVFSRHAIAVGSTGNLGLSIGIMGATFGLRTTVHMSADARAWKKDLLRSHGVAVREYAGDFTTAVTAGREEAAADPHAHFVDDEHSTSLFLGYAVAARRLRAQLQAANVIVDAEHPLFVYLPCGVGGGPGGVAFGLATEFGDAVHCLFAEPTHAPSMLLGVATGLHEAVSVHDVGLDNVTAADGLAVGRPSGFVGRAMQRLLDGFITVDDDRMFAMAAALHQAEGVAIEPSAAAGLPGPWRVLAASEYRARMDLTDERMARATHIAWLTGGSMVPASEMEAYLARGRATLARDR